MNILLAIFSLAYFFCQSISMHAMAVAVQRQQAVTMQPISYVASLQLEHFYRCFNDAQVPFSKNNITVSNAALQKDISTITTALLFAESCNPIMLTKARLNMLFFNPACSLSFFKKAQAFMTQRYCDDTGKLINYGKDKQLAHNLAQTITQILPQNYFENLFKLYDQEMCHEILKYSSSPIWKIKWDSVWQTIASHLSEHEHSATGNVETARNNQFNKDLYLLFSLCENQKFKKAEQLLTHYENESIFIEVFNFYHRPFQQKLEKQKAQALQNQKRNEAMVKTLAHPTAFTKNYHIPAPTQLYLQNTNVSPKLFESCHGSYLQQRAHKELKNINNKAALLEKSSGNHPRVKKFAKQIPKFTALACEYNKAGFVDEAFTIADFCWAILDPLFEIVSGIGKGILQGTGNYIIYLFDHPVESVMRPLLGSFIAALRLAQLTYKLINVGSIGLGALIGSENATEQWQQLCFNIKIIKNALAEKYNTLTLEKCAQETTALATQFVLDYKCAQLLSDFYQLCLDDAQRYLTAMSNPSTTAPITIAQYSHDNFAFCTGANATMILAGQGIKLIENIKKYGGNCMSASLERTLHDHINELIPSSEIELISAHTKHIPQKGIFWSKILEASKTGIAQFKPGLDVHALQKDAWNHGRQIGPEHIKIKRCDHIIGAVEGKPTHYLQVKKINNILYGKPISMQEYRNFMKTFLKNNR